MTRFRIRELREARGLSQHGLSPPARRDQMAVSRWESGAAMPTADKLPTIAALLECEVNDLYDDETLRAASEAARAAVAAKGVADARALAAGK
ncbi:MAG: helix-turn-helix domain-containing protein [Oscillospiraceae bacterium]